MKCPRCQHENPPKAKFCRECGTPFKRPNQGGPLPASYPARDLQRSLSEALEQQTTTSPALRVISSSTTDVQPVLSAIARTAGRLCEAGDALIYLVDGDRHRLVAKYGQVPQPQRVGDCHPIRRDTPLGLAVLERRPVHVRDIRADRRGRFSGLQALGFHVSRARTLVAMPLLRDGVTLGGIVIRRTRVRPFTAKQIALLKTFADQAAIAIENVRLFKELQEKNRALTEAHAQVTETLEQQMATSEILRVIGSSPTDGQPVFETIARSGVSVCAALGCAVFVVDGDLLRVAATHGVRPERVERFRDEYPIPLSAEIDSAQVVRERSVFHLADIEHNPNATANDIEYARLAGYRTRLMIPMLRGNSALGLIAVTREAPTPFPDQQVELLKTFADQAVIAIENVRLFNEVQERNRDLTVALEQQTATSEILRVISSSPTDLQPVLDAVVKSASRLCDSLDSVIFRLDGGRLRLAAHYGPMVTDGQIGSAEIPLNPGLVNARAVIESRAIHVADLQAEGAEFPEGSALARRLGMRTTLCVPLMREGVPVGVIALRRADVRPFADRQIELVTTFADQAVIAIENVRLFKELQEKNQALTAAHAQVTEALEQQTATSEILRVISSSPTDLQPVFDTIVRNAARVCEAFDAVVVLADGEEFVQRAHHGPIAAVLGARYPLRGTVGGRAILEARIVHVENLAEASDYPAGRELAQRVGYRTTLSVPLLRDGAAIGAIGIRRTEVLPFSDKQIALLQIFADQAVIAIENVRLFKELEARNAALANALERQTATGEILAVISRSQTDVQAVFDAIVRSSVALTSADIGAVLRTDGRQFFLAALHGVGDQERLKAVEGLHPRPVDPNSLSGRAILSRTIQHVPDVEAPSCVPDRALDIARTVGLRSNLVVPMLRGLDAVGVISVARREPGPFSQAQADLLETFADQAVIAIENARLFRELEARTYELTHSVEQLGALGEVGRAVSSTLDLDTVLTTIVSRAVQLAGLEAGAIYEYDETAEVFHLRATQNLPEEFLDIARPLALRKGEGATGCVAVTRQPVQIPDVAAPGAYHGRMRDVLLRLGHRAVLAVPLISEGHLVGGLVVNKRQPGDFAPDVIDLLLTFATQSALAIQNARLFREIEEKSRQLEVASQHKSEFLANMSHELRTPLNAIIGFSEVLADRMFGELNEKQEEYLKDIHASGQHLLSLINDILDLSKVEAGRMELELADFNLPTTLDNALTLVRERAGRHGVALHMSVDDRVEQVRADERKIRQVVLNLLSNAIKFTPEGGRIDVRAVPADGGVEVSVSDTGVGIAPEDQQAIFEEFRQVGTAAKKVEGTGLGLALSRKFIELHGGRIWVTSQVGAGSTFTFTLPVLRGE